jgi:hypothetical protein
MHRARGMIETRCPTRLAVHADLDVLLRRHAGEHSTRELRALMVLKMSGLSVACERVLQRLDAERRLHRDRQLPRQHAPREPVEHHREIDEAWLISRPPSSWRRSGSQTQRPSKHRVGPLRHVEPPRSDPLHHRPARGKRSINRGRSSQAKRGPKKSGRSTDQF